MNRVAAVILSAALLTPCALQAEEVPSSVYELTSMLETWGNDATLVSAVKAQNAQGMTLAAIKQKDTAWMATDGIDASMKALLENSAALRLREMEASKGYFTEVFLMDNQGANVAMTNKTSDYWQGDEAKFTESWSGGKGKVHIGKVEFDESAQAYLVQISVPVREGAQVIGALTVGINLDELEKGL